MSVKVKNMWWAVIASMDKNTQEKVTFKEAQNINRTTNEKKNSDDNPSLIDSWSLCSSETMKTNKWRITTQNLTHEVWNDFCLFQFTQLSWDSIIIRKTESSIERLSECGLDSVEESHGVRDAVEGQNTCSVIQVHSYSGGTRTWDGSWVKVEQKYITVSVTN